MATTEEQLKKKVVICILWGEEKRFQNRMSSEKTPSFFSYVNYTQKNWKD